jgi:hypothetical protein
LSILRVPLHLGVLGKEGGIREEEEAERGMMRSMEAEKPWYAPLLAMRERHRQARAQLVVVHHPCGCTHWYGADRIYRGGPPCPDSECPNQFGKTWDEVLRIRREDVRTGRCGSEGLVAHLRGDRCLERHCAVELDEWKAQEKAWAAEEARWRKGLG